MALQQPPAKSVNAAVHSTAWLPAARHCTSSSSQQLVGMMACCAAAAKAGRAVRRAKTALPAGVAAASSAAARGNVACRQIDHGQHSSLKACLLYDLVTCTLLATFSCNNWAMQVARVAYRHSHNQPEVVVIHVVNYTYFCARRPMAWQGWRLAAETGLSLHVDRLRALFLLLFQQQQQYQSPQTAGARGDKDGHKVQHSPTEPYVCAVEAKDQAIPSVPGARNLPLVSR